MRCPGQDRRYWKGDAVYQIACPRCGSAVEFFRDETRGRCGKCGHAFRNPKIALDCADWCGYAEQCLGVAPGRKPTATDPTGASGKRLLDAAERMFGADTARAEQATLVFQHAWELLAKEPCDARVVLAASLFIEPKKRSTERSDLDPATVGDRSAKLPEVTQALSRVGFDEQTVGRICEVIAGYDAGEERDWIEFKLLCDAATLSTLTAEESRGDLDKLEIALRSTLKTTAGKQRARDLFGT